MAWERCVPRKGCGASDYCATVRFDRENVGARPGKGKTVPGWTLGLSRRTRSARPSLLARADNAPLGEEIADSFLGIVDRIPRSTSDEAHMPAPFAEMRGEEATPPCTVGDLVEHVTRQERIIHRAQQQSWPADASEKP